VNGPLIVQSDRTVLLEVAHPQAEEARHELAVFAELERAPEFVHTYRITRLGLWNARAAGHTAEQMLATLERYAKFPVPQTVSIDIEETVSRYGRLVISRDDAGLFLGTYEDRGVLPQDPFVYRETLCPELKKQIQDTFLTLDQNADGKKYLDNVDAEKFVEMKDSDYNVIREAGGGK